MSYTEINDEKGMRHGGMPHDVLLAKLEETDPELVDAVTGADEFHDLEDDYKNATRAEIIDWSPDAPMLESDHARRDPAWSRSAINLRYNGTRGSHPELPAHPELFIGFTGNDPRGVDNDPRFDQVRGHITSRAANLEVSMGNNDDNAIAERPWTNQSISYGMKELHRRVRGNTKVFLTQKEGRRTGRNTAVDSAIFGVHRRAQAAGGDEGFSGDAAGEKSRFFAGDHGAAVGAETGGLRGVDHSRAADSAPWRHATGDADLAVAKYGQARGGGATRVSASGGTLVAASAHDAEYAAQTAGRGANRATVGATMAAAARFGAAMRSAVGEADYGTSYSASNSGKSALQRDVAAIYRNASADTDLGEHTAGGRAVGAGLRPARDPGAAMGRGVGASHTMASAALANVGAIVRGLREASASGRRKVADQMVAAGARVGIDAVSARGRNAAAPGDVTRAAGASDVAVVAAAAANGLGIIKYRGAAPVRNDYLRHTGRNEGAFGATEHTLAPGKGGAPHIVSADGSDVDAAVFGRVDERQSRGNVGVAPLTRRHGGPGDEITNAVHGA